MSNDDGDYFDYLKVVGVVGLVVAAFAFGRGVGLGQRAPAFQAGFISGYCDAAQSTTNTQDLGLSYVGRNIGLLFDTYIDVESLPRPKRPFGGIEDQWADVPTKELFGKDVRGWRFAEDAVALGKRICAGFPPIERVQSWIDGSDW